MYIEGLNWLHKHICLYSGTNENFLLVKQAPKPDLLEVPLWFGQLIECWKLIKEGTSDALKLIQFDHVNKLKRLDNFSCFLRSH